MDNQAIVSSVLCVLAPYVVKSGPTLTMAIGQEAVSLSGEIYETVRQHCDRDDKARRTLGLFAEDPETFQSALGKQILEQLETKNELRTQLAALVERFDQAVSREAPAKVSVSGSGAAAAGESIAAGERGLAAGRDIVNIIQQLQPAMFSVPAAVVEDSVQQQWQERADYLQAAMRAYAARVQEQLQASTPPLKTPYKGLFYYEPTDEQIFFGREKEMHQLLACIRGRGKAHCVTVLHGASGAGKTSLINAGIIPTLLRDGAVTLYALPRLGKHYQSPDATIRKRIIDAAPRDRLVPDLSDLTLHTFLRLASRGLNGKPLIIFLDQLEDFFIHLTPDARELFIAELAKCYDDEALLVKFVFLLRKEYFSDLHELESAVPAIFHNQLRLETLSTEQAVQAIDAPVKCLGVSYEPALLEMLLGDLDRGGIEPPQVQIVCSRLYEERRSNVITLEDYKQLGGAPGILAAHLSLLIEGLGRKRPVAEKVLTELATTEGIGRALSQEELEDRIGEYALGEVLERLVSARLLRRDEFAGVLQYELVHEYLIKEIGTWISDDALRLKEVQELLDRELSNWRIFGTLINPDRLQIIEKWCRGDEQLRLDREAQELIKRSQEKRALDEQEQLRIIQAAKMTSLDQLVLGIDHELNSPISCIKSNSQSLRENVTDLNRTLERLPGLLLELSRSKEYGPAFGQDEDVDGVFQARLHRYLEALSHHIDRLIRGEGLWGILEDICEISDELQQAVSKMTSLIKALSSFVQPDLVGLKPIDIHAGLTTALLLLGYELKYNLVVRHQFAQGPLTINGSPSQLVQLFMNILMNSIEAIKPRQVGGRNGVIEVRTYHDGPTGVVVIRDNGVGIPLENLEKVFSPGFTTKEATHKGLGLSIAKQITERHSGQIEIYSELQKGTTLTIKFPLADVEDDHEH